MRIVVAGNDPSLGTFLKRSFEAENYVVDLAADQDAERAVEAVNYDAALLDFNEPSSHSLDVLRQVRSRRPYLPVVVLTSRAGAENCVSMLDSGADDLILKPFVFSELSARIRALLRRGAQTPDAVLRVHDLELSRIEHTVKRGGERVQLTPKEFALLEYLMSNVGQCVTRPQIIEHVWNLSFDTMTNVVDVYINYLRKKVDAGSGRKLIRTVRGTGYQIQGASPPNASAD
jgi:two-component system copper resistance phosphate regulon response regulator CusR